MGRGVVGNVHEVQVRWMGGMVLDTLNPVLNR
jgi:hypothetical protein